MEVSESQQLSGYHPDVKVLWLHRRSIAYLSVAGLFILIIAMFFGVIEKDVVPLAQTISWVFCFNIIGYIANNAFENVARMKFSKT